MQYALSLPNGGSWGDPHSLAELAHLAEESGQDAVLLEDYVVRQSRQDVPTYEPWISLAAIAMRTSRIRLGTNATTLARRRPWNVAREAATLDHLSNGRVILGVGLGDAGKAIGQDISLTHFGETLDARERAHARRSTGGDRRVVER